MKTPAPGRTSTISPGSATMPLTPEPTLPWCGLLWPDSTPVSLAEAEAVRRYTTGERRALLYEDFQSPPPQSTWPGWTTYGTPEGKGSSVLRLDGNRKMVAGDPALLDSSRAGRLEECGSHGP